MIDGGPSVLYDAVALVVSAAGVADLCKEASAKDFVADAFTHCKYIAYVAEAMPLLEKVGIAGDLDEGTVAIKDKATAASFLDQAENLRFWPRELAVKLN